MNLDDVLQHISINPKHLVGFLAKYEIFFFNRFVINGLSVFLFLSFFLCVFKIGYTK